jgi:hypothetical protein
LVAAQPLVSAVEESKEIETEHSVDATPHIKSEPYDPENNQDISVPVNFNQVMHHQREQSFRLVKTPVEIVTFD